MPPLRDRPRLGVAGVAVGLRLIAAAALARAPVGLHDPLLYQRFAQGIAKGQGYVSFYGRPTSYYPPGYPFFVGALQWICDRVGAHGSLPIAAALAESLLGGLTAWAVVGVGERVFPERNGRWRVGLVAGLLVAVWPNLVLQSATLLSENLYLALFASFLLTFVVAFAIDDTGRRAGALVGAGVLLGLCALVRPQVALVAVAIVVAGLFAKISWPQRAAMVAIPALAAAAIVAPWTIRNATVFHRFVAVSTNGGDNLCVGFHPGATGHFEVPKYCDTGEFYIDGPAPEARRNLRTTKLARSWAVHHLGALPLLSLRKLWYTYEHDHDGLRAVESYEQHRFLPGAVRAALKWSSDLFYAAVMLAAFAGAVLAARRLRRDTARRGIVAFLLVATTVSALLPVLFFGETRFKVPATPCFALLAALAVVTWADRR